MPNYHTLTKKYCYIYIIINNVNGKIYIGQHRTNDLDDGYMGSGKLLIRAFNKYGIEKFIKKILHHCPSLEEANLLEEQEILSRDATNRSVGYNISKKAVGGQGQTATSRKKISESTTGVAKSEKHKSSMKKPKSKRHIENMRLAQQKAAEKKRGKHWYHHPETLEARTYNYGDEPTDWIKGRPKKHFIGVHTPESNFNRGSGSRGKTRSVEEKEKTRAGVIKNWKVRHAKVSNDQKNSRN